MAPTSDNYKKQLKKLISVNLPDLLFLKSTQKNKPEQLISPFNPGECFKCSHGLNC